MGDTVVIDGETSLLTALDADMSLLIPEHGECGIVTAFREYPAYTGPVEFTPSEEERIIDAAGVRTQGTASGGGGSVQDDTRTATASNYPTSLAFSSMKGQPKFFALRLNAQVSSSGSTSYYYIVDIISNGTTTHGNCFRIGSTRRVENITSGYSWSYSGGTLTITSSAASRSASPGAFYNGSYELMYAY